VSCNEQYTEYWKNFEQVHCWTTQENKNVKSELDGSQTILVLEQKKAPGNLCTGLVQRWVSKSSAHRATKLLKLHLYKIAAIQ
jgi:hypothetical protein